MASLFTGKERDSESGLDYFGARNYGSALGRWTSPDAVNLTDERLINPANTLNKYVYGANNPLKYIDPDGKDITVFYEQGNFTQRAHELVGNSGLHLKHKFPSHPVAQDPVRKRSARTSIQPGEPS